MPETRPGQPVPGGGWDETLPSIPDAPDDLPTPDNTINVPVPTTPVTPDPSVAIVPLTP